MIQNINEAPPASEIFNRTERLLGDEAMRRLSELKVIVVGVGGVGSWTAEALILGGRASHDCGRRPSGREQYQPTAYGNGRHGW